MKRIVIDRLDLHMRGVPPATARAAARKLDAALRRQLSGTTVPDAAGGARNQAADARGLADRAARQVAGRIGKQS